MSYAQRHYTSFRLRAGTRYRWVLPQFANKAFITLPREFSANEKTIPGEHASADPKMAIPTTVYDRVSSIAPYQNFRFGGSTTEHFPSRRCLIVRISSVSVKLRSTRLIALVRVPEDIGTVHLTVSGPNLRRESLPAEDLPPEVKTDKNQHHSSPSPEDYLLSVPERLEARSLAEVSIKKDVFDIKPRWRHQHP